jgi:hypothetical protein
MADFDLDLGAIEEDLEADEDRSDGRIVLDILDGETPSEEWLDLVEAGHVLVLSIDGPLEKLAADFAPDIDQAGGSIVHFRDFLIAAPPTVTIDTDRL